MVLAIPDMPPRFSSHLFYAPRIVCIMTSPHGRPIMDAFWRGHMVAAVHLQSDNFVDWIGFSIVRIAE